MMNERRRRLDRRAKPLPESSDDPSARRPPEKVRGDRDPFALRELAAWYRGFAEQAGNPTIWDARLRTAEDLDAEADRLERQPASSEP